MDENTPEEGAKDTSTNRAYEQQMRAEGSEKYKEKAGGETSVDKRPPHFHSLTDALPKVSEVIQKTLKEAKQSTGRVPAWVGELSTIDADTLAYVGLLCCFNGVLKEQTITQVTQAIGQHLEQELLSSELKAEDKAKHTEAVETARAAGLERPKPRNTNKRLVEQVTSAHNSREHRLKTLRIITTKNGFSSKNFGVAKTKEARAKLKERRTKLAAPVLSSVLEASNVFDRELEWEGHKQRKSVICFTKEAFAAMEANELRMSWMSPVFKPMLAAPVPWGAFDTGAYHDANLASMVPIVRGGSHAQREAITHQLSNGMPNWCRALNALQATPYSINEPVLNAVQWCWENKKHGLNKFPRHSVPDRPRLDEDWKHQPAAQVAAVKAEIRKHLKLEMRVKGATVVMEQDLQTARELVAFETNGFFIPQNCDFRGRMYPVSTFNMHRDSHLKALFCYKRGYMVEGNNVQWLKVHLANCGDFEKISKQPLDARAKWVDDHHEELLAIAADYKGTFDLWSAADKPFEYLAAVFEYARWVEEGVAFVSYIPLSHDATNSGVQIYAGLNLSETEGALVNLTPSNTMSDIYGHIASKVVESLKDMGSATDAVVFNEKTGTTVGDLRERWMAFDIQRSTCKRPVMTFGYSSKSVGMRGQFMEDLMKPLQLKVTYGEIEKHPFHETEQGQFECAWFMGDLVYQTISNVLLKTGESMDYLQAAAKAVAGEDKAIRWTSASGFPVYMEYKKTKVKEIKIFLFDRVVKERKRTKVTLREELDQVNVTKSCSAIAPNFVHSQDAALLQNFICAQLDAGTSEDFFMIHDSLSISGDVWDLYDGVRQSFVDMFSGGCLFEKFEEEIRQQLNDPTKPFTMKVGDTERELTIPAKGTLDLEAVKGNQFCFS